MKKLLAILTIAAGLGIFTGGNTAQAWDFPFSNMRALIDLSRHTENKGIDNQPYSQGNGNLGGAGHVNPVVKLLLPAGKDGEGNTVPINAESLKGMFVVRDNSNTNTPTIDGTLMQAIRSDQAKSKEGDAGITGSGEKGGGVEVALAAAKNGNPSATLDKKGLDELNNLAKNATAIKAERDALRAELDALKAANP